MGKTIALAILLILTAVFGFCTYIGLHYLLSRDLYIVGWEEKDTRVLKICIVGTLLCAAAVWALLEQ